MTTATANPKPDASALVAGVRVISDILRERVRVRLGDAGDASTLLIYVEELEAHLATVESELSDLRTREAALAEENELLTKFAERVGMASDARNMELTTANGEEEMGDVTSAYIHTLDNVGREAWALLTKLGKSKSPRLP